MRERSRIVLSTIGVLVAILVLCGALVWTLQRRMIYFPGPGGAPRAADWLPSAEEVSLGTEDGLTLGAWFLRPAAGPPRATVLVFNGNGGHRGLRAPLAEGLARRGLAVLLFDYRGYGGNPGAPSEQGLRRDARAARAYLESRRDVQGERIVYLGESLGAGVATGLAEEAPPLLLVLRSPFSSMADVARVHYPLLPVGLLLREKYPSLERIRRLRVPLLVVAGEHDRIVPAAQSRRLFDAAPHPRKRFVPVPGADHNDPQLTGGEPLIGALTGFLDELLPTIEETR